jgi:ribosomal-protein-alanine N-acetyltransferase
MTISIRAAVDADADDVATIWEAGWREAHAGRVPNALIRARTPATFTSRARANTAHTTVATVDGIVAGFVMVVHDELEQVYVDSQHRGSGIAAALLSAAERIIAAAGFPSAWLAVVAGNERARRFYDRNGWTDEGDFTYHAAVENGSVDVPCRRYLKQLQSSPRATDSASAPWWEYVDRGDGLLLRALSPADADGVLAVHGDPRVYELDPHERHPNVEHSRRFLAPLREHWTRFGFGYWAVLVPRAWWPGGPEGAGLWDADRVHAGVGGIQHHSVAGRPVLNVYFRLAPAIQGRGVAGYIVATSIRMAPHVAPGVDLVIRTRPANIAARRVATRAGFVDEGPEPGASNMQLLRLPKFVNHSDVDSPAAGDRFGQHQDST